MSAESGDQDLRELFQRLRREETRRTPPFHRLWEAARGRRGMAPRISRGGLVFVIACAGALLVWAIRSGLPKALRPAGDATPTAISQWRSPTDFLLKVPGETTLSMSMNEITGQMNGRLP